MGKLEVSWPDWRRGAYVG